MSDKEMEKLKFRIEQAMASLENALSEGDIEWLENEAWAIVGFINDFKGGNVVSGFDWFSLGIYVTTGSFFGGRFFYDWWVRPERITVGGDIQGPNCKPLTTPDVGKPEEPQSEPKPLVWEGFAHYYALHGFLSLRGETEEERIALWRVSGERVRVTIEVLPND